MQMVCSLFILLIHLFYLSLVSKLNINSCNVKVDKRMSSVQTVSIPNPPPRQGALKKPGPNFFSDLHLSLQNNSSCSTVGKSLDLTALQSAAVGRSEAAGHKSAKLASELITTDSKQNSLELS